MAEEVSMLQKPCATLVTPPTPVPKTKAHQLAAIMLPTIPVHHHHLQLQPPLLHHLGHHPLLRNLHLLQQVEIKQ